jgi:hypothetical protein
MFMNLLEFSNVENFETDIQKMENMEIFAKHLKPAKDIKIQMKVCFHLIFIFFNSRSNYLVTTKLLAFFMPHLLLILLYLPKIK